ncbi:MAG: FRG domain-containing protein [Lentisphaeria bacterium]|nr:FRG domain-containing protein [Lentisphaeria bacterium]
MCDKVFKIRIESWEDISDCLLYFSQGYLFRGHGDASWKLETSLERKYNKYVEETDFINKNPDYSFRSGLFANPLTLKEEFSAIQNYKRLIQLQHSEITNAEILARMQHYGTPTRLLDVTSSFLIALFFAFEESCINDRAIWVFNESYFYKNSPLVQNVINTDFDKEIEEWDVFSKLMSNKEMLYEKILEATEKCIVNENNNNQQLSIIPLKIEGNNPRLIAQNSSFLFPTTLNPFKDHLLKSLKMQLDEFNEAMNKSYSLQDLKKDNMKLVKAAVIKLEFPVKTHCYVEQLLNNANISAYTMYPDEIGIAKSIKYW